MRNAGKQKKEKKRTVSPGIDVNSNAVLRTKTKAKSERRKTRS